MAAHCGPIIPITPVPVTPIPGIPSGPGWVTVTPAWPAQGVIFVPARRR